MNFIKVVIKFKHFFLEAHKQFKDYRRDKKKNQNTS